MKSTLAAGAAVLFSALFISSCSANPPAAPVVSEGTINETSPFRPDKSNCVSDLTTYAKLFGDLSDCIRSVVEEIDREPEQNLPANPRQVYMDDEFKHSPCQSDLTQLRKSSSTALGQCYQMAWVYLKTYATEG